LPDSAGASIEVSGIGCVLSMLTAKHAYRLLSRHAPQNYMFMGARLLLSSEDRLTLLSGRYIVVNGNLNERSHLPPEPHKNRHAAMLALAG
jgi:hypothetical protein